MANEIKEVRPVITSIGVENGRAVARLNINGSVRQISINMVDFAQLAAAGVRVVNV